MKLAQRGTEALAQTRTCLQVIDEFRGLTAEEWEDMKTQEKVVCPRCSYPLVPVHAVEGTKRRVIALTCPEPYCDHMQMIPEGRSHTVPVTRPNLRAAN